MEANFYLEALPLQPSVGDQTCPRCGASSFAATRVKTALCERCLLDLALQPLSAEQCAGKDRRPRQSDPMPVSDPGQTLGSYFVVEEIGRGGMGIIYRGRHKETGDTVALKTIPASHIGCEEILVRFRREAEAVSSLVHSHIMPIYEVGSDEAGTPFFSMKLAVGGSLHQLREKYRGRWRQIAELMEKISKAIHHAHEMGILHRDLKPGNILFTEDQEPLITDFGLAKALTGSDDLTQSCAVLGTPNYVSPEQAAGQTRDIGPASDVYSLGAILFELLTGRPPFTGDNPLEVLQQISTRSPQRPRKLVPAVPKTLEVICLRCLERWPEDRYHSAAGFAADLGRWLQGRQITSEPTYTRLWRRIRRQSKIRIWCWVVILLAATLWTAWRMVARTEPAPSGLLTVAVAIDDLGQDPSLKLAARQVTDELKRNLVNSGMFGLQGGSAGEPHSPTQILDPIAYGRECNAQMVLTGCVRHLGGQVHLAARLVRCDTEALVWRYSGNLPSNPPAWLLPTVARGIVRDLETKLRSDPGSFTMASRYHPLPGAQTFYTRATELVARTNEHDLEAAVVSFRQAAEMDPHFIEARAMLAFALWAQADSYGETGKVPLALSSARDVLAVDPNCSQAHRVVGSCYFSAARYKEALEEFWTAFELNPMSVGCCQSLAMCLRATGHLHQAIPFLARAVQLDSARGTTSTILGEALAVSGYDQQAGVALTHAIEIDGDQPDSQIDLSALRTWQKDFGEARRLCAQIRLHFPNYRFTQNLAPWIEFCDGKNAVAASLFESLRASGNYRQNWEFYGAINPASALAYLAKEAGSTERAHLLAEEALKIDGELLVKYPHNARILHDLAATNAFLGEEARALSLLENSISAGWVEHRSTEIDPRFSSIANHPRFKQILDNANTDLP